MVLGARKNMGIEVRALNRLLIVSNAYAEALE
jgi:hypothetical protein